MKKILLIALVLLTTVGCSETEVDIPSFVEGQATALTIDKLQDDFVDLVAAFQWDRDGQGGGAGTVGIRFDETVEFACVRLTILLYRYEEYGRNLNPDMKVAFSEEYQGKGVWLVQIITPQEELFPSSDFVTTYKWKVYESTGTVETIGTHWLKDGVGTDDMPARRYIC
jgi:hypothetical protein